MTDGDYRLAGSDLDMHDGGRNRPDTMHCRMEYGSKNGGRESRREGKARGELEGEGRRGREYTRSARHVTVDHA